MLDRPIPFNERLRQAWPIVETQDAAIERTLGRLACATEAAPALRPSEQLEALFAAPSLPRLGLAPVSSQYSLDR